MYKHFRKHHKIFQHIWRSLNPSQCQKYLDLIYSTLILPPVPFSPPPFLFLCASLFCASSLPPLKGTVALDQVGLKLRVLSPYFWTLMEPRNRFQGRNSVNLCCLAGWYENPIPPQFLAHIDSVKVPALSICSFVCKFIQARLLCFHHIHHRGWSLEGRLWLASWPA